MDFKDKTIGDQHRELVKGLNKFFPDYFESKKGLISSNELHKELNVSDLHNLAILTSRVLNMHGASSGDVNLYKLFQSYFLDLEKRKAINEIL